MDGVKVWYFSAETPRRLYRSAGLKKELQRSVGNFDIVHLHSIFLWPTWVAARMSRKSNVPYIISPRGMLVRALVRRKSRIAKTVWINLVEKRNLEAAAAIHATSKTEAGDIAQFGFKLKKIVIVPNGVDMPPEDPSDNNGSAYIKEIMGKGPYLLFLGRISWKKGLDRLIPALNRVPDIRLIIAGNDEENYRLKLDKLIGKNGLDDRVVFCGPVYGSDKNALFRNARVFVLPSYSENFGISVLEAMAAGCPVAVTPEVGASEIVKESEAGVVIKGDPTNLGRELLKLLSDAELLNKMGGRGKRTVVEKYAWDAFAQTMENAYRDVQREKAGKE